MPIEQLTYWLSHLTQNSPFLFAVLDENHHYLWTSQRYSEISGLSQKELVGKQDKDILGFNFYNAVKPHYQQAFNGQSCEGEIVLGEGLYDSSFHFSVSPFEHKEQHPSLKNLITFHAVDTSERQVLTDALKSSESRFENLCKLVGEGCCVLDNGVVMTANSHAVKMLGFDNIHEILGENIETLLFIPNKNISLSNAISKLKAGEQLKCLSKNAPMQNALAVSHSPVSLLGGKGSIIAFSQINGSGIEHQKLENLAQFNPLTGLYNRVGFSRCLEQLIANETPLLMLYLDVDNFKSINDSLGHHIGDRVLQDIAQRLRRQLPSETILGHFGGDEFAILMPEQNTPKTAQILADKIVHLMSQPFDIYHFRKHLTCSIGLVKYPGDGKDPRSLLQNADTAMYEAKGQGHNRVMAYNQHMNKEARMRLWLEIELQKALQNNALEVWYQPKVDAKTHLINGAEALIRWKHPAEGYISPVRFIPVAEYSGMIEQLGRNVMREVFQYVQRWKKMNVLPGRVAINLSPQQFKNAHLITQMKTLLEATQTDPSFITFELTENTVMQDSEHTIQMLNSIKELGFALSIDDFGTGYSSLSYLARFPLDELKIDRMFISNMATLPKQITLIENIIHLGRALKMSVVAEGVETQEQVKTLTQLQCDTIQGFYFYKPMARHDFEALLIRNLKDKNIRSKHC